MADYENNNVETTETVTETTYEVGEGSLLGKVAKAGGTIIAWEIGKKVFKKLKAKFKKAPEAKTVVVTETVTTKEESAPPDEKKE